MMRYKLLCKVPTGQNFVLLKASATLSPDSIYEGETSVLKIETNLSPVIADVTLSDYESVTISKIDELTYLLKSNVNEEKNVEIYITIKDNVYKQTKNITLILHLLSREQTNTIGNNYSATQTEESSNDWSSEV